MKTFYRIQITNLMLLSLICAAGLFLFTGKAKAYVPIYSCSEVINAVPVYSHYHYILNDVFEGVVKTELSDPNYYKLLAFFEREKYSVEFIDELIKEMISLEVQIVLTNIKEGQFREVLESSDSVTPEEVEFLVNNRHRIGAVAITPDHRKGKRLIILPPNSEVLMWGFRGNFVHEALHHRMDVDEVWTNPKAWVNTVDNDRNEFRTVFEEFWVHFHEWRYRLSEPEWPTVMGVISSEVYQEPFDKNVENFELFMFYIYKLKNYSEVKQIQPDDIYEGFRTGTYEVVEKFRSEIVSEEFEEFKNNLSRYYQCSKSILCTLPPESHNFRPQLIFRYTN